MRDTCRFAHRRAAAQFSSFSLMFCMHRDLCKGYNPALQVTSVHTGLLYQTLGFEERICHTTAENNINLVVKRTAAGHFELDQNILGIVSQTRSLQSVDDGLPKTSRNRVKADGLMFVVNPEGTCNTKPISRKVSRILAEKIISEPQTCARNYRDSGGGCVASSTSRSSVPG